MQQCRVLATLTRHVSPTLTRRHACDIPTAAKRACCSAAVIVRLIQEGALPTVASRMAGYLGVLVDGPAAQKLSRSHDNGGMSIVAARHALATNDRVVKALIPLGHLETFVAPNPVNRCPQTLITSAEIGRFNDTYIMPALDPEEVCATSYRRSDVPAI